MKIKCINTEYTFINITDCLIDLFLLCWLIVASVIIRLNNGESDHVQYCDCSSV